MKKTFIISGLLLCASSLAAMANLINLDTYVEKDGVKSSVWEAMLDKTRSQAFENFTADRYGANASIDNQSIMFSQLFNGDSLEGNFLLNSFSVMGPDAFQNTVSYNWPENITVTISDGSNFSVTSSAMDVSAYGGSVPSKFQELKFSFDDPVLIDLGKAYTVTFSGDFAHGVVKVKNSSSISGTPNSGQWYSVFRASGSSPIPEPSVFALLAGMGSLALVASRRRRK